MASTLPGRTRRRLALAAALVAIAAVPPPSTAEPDDKPADRCVPQRDAVLGSYCRRADGLLAILGDDGRVLGLTHGPDPLPPDGGEAPVGPSDGPSAAAPPPRCTEPADDPAQVLAFYVELVYARPSDATDQYAAKKEPLRDALHAVDTMLHLSAQGTGATSAALRVLCDATGASVRHVVLPFTKSAASFASIWGGLAAAGLTKPNVKYLVYYDDVGFQTKCACAGFAHVWDDDVRQVTNRNNGHPLGGSIPAVVVGGNPAATWTRIAMTHEILHSMGTVVNSAPHATGKGHCWDGLDVMCYNDGGPSGHLYSNAVCPFYTVDCRNDDYFHATARTGHVGTRWNAGWVMNRFLDVRGSGGFPLDREAPSVRVAVPGDGIYNGCTLEQAYDPTVTSLAGSLRPLLKASGCLVVHARDVGGVHHVRAFFDHAPIGVRNWPDAVGGETYTFHFALPPGIRTNVALDVIVMDSGIGSLMTVRVDTQN